MSAFCGMDTGRGREQSGRLLAGADRLHLLALLLRTATTAAAWEGADAEAFRDRVSTAAVGPLLRAELALRATGARLRAEAAAQDAASAVDRSPAPGAGASPDIAAGPAMGAVPAMGAAPALGAVPALGAMAAGSAASARSGPSGRVLGVAAVGRGRAGSPGASAWPSSAAEISAGIGEGLDLAGERVLSELDARGVRTEGLEQLGRDADRFGAVLEDWTAGGRTPTLAQLVSGAILVTGSGGVGILEAATGEDSPFLDDRPGGIVHAVRSDETRTPAPASLPDLIRDNAALRRRAGDAGPLPFGRIGIQEVLGADGARAYIVQVPPTEGAPITSAPDSWGGQGASRDWASNLRLVAGQHPAAMHDVRAALSAPGPGGDPLVPPGSRVLLVGHSQGGIVATHLAADPTFNSTSGAPGTYAVTHTLSIGSPVQTVLPADPATQVVNVTHGPLSLGAHGASGDPIAHLDLQGLRVDGSRLTSPQVHEVLLDSGESAWDAEDWLRRNHDSLGPQGEPALGYAGTLARGTAQDPVLRGLERELTGVYLGEGATVTASHVVEVGRTDLSGT
ncbi:hypothetical protein BF93_18515 [Brachybacterium phenoliresistens]|uniref:Uncharacterized protein n=1 Tax=Brachybacterium phenoliresistens TaxID=396014 RepID=Z9JTS7_9MICO|nr:hypothetical protein [Brachybacterium phenoliresistens]EWS81162.1 hypothetical protein BF93_18515 [Brachybacterium phenoliresistens]